MRYSKSFVRTLKSAPSSAETINHKLLVQGGYVRQVMAGVYTYLPMGLRVLNKISQIVREEMNTIGGQEVLMPLMHPSRLWKQTGGWDSIDVLFHVTSRTKREYALAQSNEETVTPLAREFIHSHKDMPLSVYHINWKFRDELRSKSGILRGREFLMKDLYSFHATQADFEKFYERAKKAYLRVFERLGLVAKVTEASGGAFSEKVSYEFEVLSEAGEANILYCNSCEWCVNTDDIKDYQKGEDCPKCKGSKLSVAKAAEVGNVFDLGQKYTKAFDMKFTDQDGKQGYPIMGCYGIGISRTMGVLVEKFHDEDGIIWPEAVAPYLVHLAALTGGNSKVKERAEEVYTKLERAGVEVLYDDREEVSAGEKLAEADLVGMPYRVVVSAKTKEQVEVKNRSEGQVRLLRVEELLQALGH